MEALVIVWLAQLLSLLCFVLRIILLSGATGLLVKKKPQLYRNQGDGISRSQWAEVALGSQLFSWTASGNYCYTESLPPKRK